MSSAAFLLDNVSEAVYYTSCDRQITAWNEQASRLTGYDRHVLGRPCQDNIIKHVDHAGHVLCTTPRCPLLVPQRTKRPYEATMLVHHAHGHLVEVNVRTVPEVDAEGTVQGVGQFFELAAERAPGGPGEKWRRAATTDVLTGLGNRRLFGRVWSSLRRRRDLGEVGLGLLMVDIDNFKSINDRYGHPHGDKVLRAVSKTLATGTRQSDSLFRWGGEEFVLLTTPANAKTLGELAERLRATVEKSWTVLPDGSHLATTISIGGALWQEGEPSESLVARADAYLLTCKRSGKNQCLVS